MWDEIDSTCFKVLPQRLRQGTKESEELLQNIRTPAGVRA
jgi:hypothetical protein